ncbi:MAG: hypothetical protein KDC05_15550, partial [Bacteroidales bacterium]|nr:hypothetical protein [Bacteroidales bacterium]
SKHPAMPANYVVNTKPGKDGNHKIHVQGCSKISYPSSCLDLGIHINYSIAVKEAKLYFPKIITCEYCIDKKEVSVKEKINLFRFFFLNY